MYQDFLKITVNKLTKSSDTPLSLLSLFRMESISGNSTINLLKKQILTRILEWLNLSTFVLLFSIEAHFIIRKTEPFFHFLLLSIFLILFTFKSFLSNPTSSIYLVDFSCYKPPNYCKVPFSRFIQHIHSIKFLDSEGISFMAKVLSSSGQSEFTYLPPALHHVPLKSNHYEATKEAQMVLFPVFENLISKTKITPQDVDILIVNCSGFCPNPSLSSLLVNKYSMRENVKTFNITGMGCSASALCIDMAKNLLQVHKNCNAIILSTEILSTGWYPGSEKSMLVLNCVFRMGSAAILVTNKSSAKKHSKYKLLWSLRSQRSFDDKGYYCAFREEDSLGLTGVTLRRDIIQVVGELLQSNATILGLAILPVKEIIWYVFSVFWKKYVNKGVEIYSPNFKKVIQHFCLPTSGRPVIREIGKGLKLGETDIEAALVTLHRFGNQSSSSLWYELAYLEAKNRVKKGDKVWQLGVGSGPKCTSLVWECVRPIVGEADKGPWDDCFDWYPGLLHDKV